MDSLIAESDAVKPEKFGKNFLMLGLHTGFSRAGTSAFAVAVIWIALTLTGSPVVSGFAEGFVSLPLFLSFLFGAYIDTLESKRKLAVASAASRSVSILLLVLAVYYDSLVLRVVAIYSVAFLLGMTSDILNSVRSSWMKQFLSENQFKMGSSFIESTTALAQGVGFGFSGIMLSLGDYYTIYAIAGIFATAIIPLFRIRENDERPAEPFKKQSFRESLGEGISFVFRSTFMRAAIILTLIANLAFGAVGILFAYMVDYVFRLPAIYYGILFVMITAGIMLGSIFASQIRGKIGFYNAIFIFILGALLMIMPLMKEVYAEFAIALGIGVLIGMVNVITETGVLKAIKQEMLARIMGAISTFSLAVTFISGGLGGALIGLFTLRWAFLIIGASVSTVAFVSIGFRDYYNITV